jgi:hypothetical protein
MCAVCTQTANVPHNRLLTKRSVVGSPSRCDGQAVLAGNTALLPFLAFEETTG